VAAALLVATMLFVPIGILILGRSLVPALDRFGELFRVTPTATSTTAAAEAVGPNLRVKVLDGEGNALGGVAVRVVSTTLPFDVVGQGQTDGTGSASFMTVHLPHVRVIASRDPDGVVTSNELEILDGETAVVELALSAAEAIRGTVVDEEDHPVAGAVLSVEGMVWALPGAASDAEGAFNLVTVPHEATALVAVARGYKAAKVSLESRGKSTTPSELVVRIKLISAPPVLGDVSDVDGNPIRGRVMACEGEAAEAQTTTTADGKFELPPSVIGCSVVALNDAYAASDPVLAVEGQRLALRFRPGGGIEGVVVDERGSAITTFALGIESFSAARGKSLRSGNQRTFEDRSGFFRWERLAPGTYVLTASAAGKPPTRSDPVDVAGGTVTRGIRIVLSRGGVVKGHVYDERHAALAEVDLSFDQVSSVVASAAHARTDESGSYVLEGAPAGPFTVRAEKHGFRQRMVTGLVAASGATLVQDITLTASSAANGGGNLEFGGIGATMQQTRDGISFQSVFPGDPADRAGLRAGDVVVRIDGESTESMSIADALQKLRGEAGTTVGVSVQRAGAGGPGTPRETVDTMVVRAVVVH